jgi:16S rRNA (cytosine967-C5)-methyltransferase
MVVSSRRLCYDLLRRWDTTTEHAQDLLGVAFAKGKVPNSEHALVQNLLFGVLRERRVLDLWISHLRKDALDDHARRAIQLGLYQLFFTRIPDHAAVNETIGLVKRRVSGVVNALLRRAIRERSKLQALAEAASPSMRYSLPDFLYQKWLRQWGEEGAQLLCEWNQQPAPNFMRINRLKPKADARVQEAGLKRLEGEGDDFFIAEPLPRDLLEQGYGYIQDPSTILACDLLAPTPSDKVLDACAAPGGKTAYLAQLMNDQGVITATDSIPDRLQRLSENTARMGISNVRAQLYDWKAPEPGLPKFDKILIDVPCSNTGVLRRRVDLRWRLKPTVFADMSALQLALCEQVLTHLKPGGRAVYSTCSIEREENEAVVERILETFPKLRLVRVVRSVPHKDGQDGAFGALLETK